MTNRDIYNDIAKEISKATTKKYSTSFSLGINFFSADIRPSIYGIYGFVRFADEIVDTFFDQDQEKLIIDFEKETLLSIQRKFSSNPILHSFQKTINEILYEKTKKAMEQFLTDKKNIEKNFVIAGGVASNLDIRKNLTKLSDEKKFSPIFPPINLCSDNAAMIAWAGIERYKMNLIDNLEFSSKARWPLDSSAPFLKGPGLKI